MLRSLVGSEMCIRDRGEVGLGWVLASAAGTLVLLASETRASPLLAPEAAGLTAELATGLTAELAALS